MANTTTFRTLAAACIVLLTAVPAALATRPCPPDINCSGAVTVDDLLAVINAWGPCPVPANCPADITGDGQVNINDLLLVINAWGPCVFNFGPAYANAEAHQIGLELLGSAGPLTLPATTYARIDRDLGLIRAAYPGLLNQTHSPAWVPNQLMVSVPNPQSPGYQCLNTYYQVTNIQPLFSTWYVLTFAGKVNVEALAGVYVASGEVTYAEPNGIIGGENFWHPADLGSGVWRWSIDDGFLDCFDGCDCHRYYVIDVNAAGQISLISYNEQGAAWCVFN